MYCDVKAVCAFNGLQRTEQLSTKTHIVIVHVVYATAQTPLSFQILLQNAALLCRFRVRLLSSTNATLWGVIQCAECREHKRWIERENARLRNKAKKEETRRLREFVDRCYALDPRVLAYKENIRLEKENKKLEKLRAQKVRLPVCTVPVDCHKMSSSIITLCTSQFCVSHAILLPMDLLPLCTVNNGTANDAMTIELEP